MNKVTSISHISAETKEELTRIKGELTAREGKDYNYDEVIQFLIEYYRKGGENDRGK